ncbi:MAG TPA: cysteine rich repeat-containing protein [Syntrophales bacterium]|nr:cysteine rich repeat-containing protein [Syntrophales bacterium]
MKKMLIISCTVMVILFLVVAPAFSQDQSQTVTPQSGKGACKSDIKEFCKGIKPGGGRIWTCLKSNEDRLSQGCKDHIVLMRENRKEFKQACKDDFNKFCKGTSPGKGRFASCLKSHESELSDTCRAQFHK